MMVLIQVSCAVRRYHSHPRGTSIFKTAALGATNPNAALAFSMKFLFVFKKESRLGRSFSGMKRKWNFHNLLYRELHQKSETRGVGSRGARRNMERARA